MNYIYDVFINLNKEAYDFYDWNVNDDIIHIRKIPVFKVSNKVIYDLKNSIINVEKDFLIKVYNKTEVFHHSSVRRIDYCLILTDGIEAFAVKFKYSGRVDLISKFLIDEENEILEFSDDLEEVTINYNIVEKKLNDNQFKTRLEVKLEYHVKKSLEKLKNESNKEVLNYLHYECFNKKEEDIDKILTKINNSLISNDHKIIIKIYEFLKLISIKKETKIT